MRTSALSPQAGSLSRRGARSVLGLGLAATAALAAAAIAPRPRLPQPSGPFLIGTTTCRWTDVSRPELFTTDPDHHRSLLAQIWYPAEPSPGAETARYTDQETSAALSGLLDVPAVTLGLLPRARTHAHPDAPIAAGRHPVLIRLSGHSGFRGEAQARAEDLASHGYVVIGLDQPGTAVRTVSPDGSAVTAWSRAFFDYALRGESVPLLDGHAAAWPEVRVERKDARFTGSPPTQEHAE